MDQLVQRITEADDIALSEIVQAVIKRYGALHSDWEIMFLSLPKYDVEERNRILRSVSEILVESDTSGD
jgi:hypothetical protein